MSVPKILLFHGKEGSPNGRKATFLKEHPKYNAHVPSYPSNEGPVSEVFDQCYTIAQQELAQFQPDLVIGSSFGGGILLRLVTEKRWTGPSLFLAQAGVMYNISTAPPQGLQATLIHGTKDTIVDYQDSVLLAESSAKARLILTNDSHGLENLLGGLFELTIDHLLQS